LFEESADAILLIGESGVFVECNQAALSLLKMSREQFINLPPVDISPQYQPDGRRSDEKSLDMIAQAYQKGLHRFDWVCVNSEGGEFIVEVSLMPIVVKGQTMLHTTWRDICNGQLKPDTYPATFFK
jgi:PAS domain S-box-containing protein